MTFDPSTDNKAEQLYTNIHTPTADANRRAVLAILDRAESAEEAASLLAMLDLHQVAEGLLAERENQQFEDGVG